MLFSQHPATNPNEKLEKKIKEERSRFNVVGHNVCLPMDLNMVQRYDYIQGIRLKSFYYI